MNSDSFDLAAAETEFARGLATAKDPQEAEVEEGTAQTTTLRSEWFHQLCPVCGHTFRAGDQVVRRDGQVVHMSRELPCAGGGGEDEGLDAAVRAAFYRGLDQAWPPPAHLTIIRLEGRSRLERDLLAPPFARMGRRRCAVCSHTLRPGDSVILCPCAQTEPGFRGMPCGIAIHRDPLNDLNCWTEWNPGGRRIHCPATSRLTGA